MKGLKKVVMDNGLIMYEGKGYTEPPKRIKRKEKIKRLLCHLKDVK